MGFKSPARRCSYYSAFRALLVLEKDWKEMFIDPTPAEPFIKRYIVLVAFAFPLFVALAGAMGKILVRSSGISRKDFFLGQELTLAAISAGLVNVLDIAKDAQPQHFEGFRLLFTGSFTGVSFFVFISVMVLHQVWEKRDNAADLKKQAIWLGFVSNTLGLFLLFIFMWMKLGGSI
jgi:hypothetical protein